MKFGNIVGGNLTIFDKDHDTVEKGRSPEFLQPSIRLRYNYYVQLVVIKRDWMCVANLKSQLGAKPMNISIRAKLSVEQEPIIGQALIDIRRRNPMCEGRYTRVVYKIYFITYIGNKKVSFSTKE